MSASTTEISSPAEVPGSHAGRSRRRLLAGAAAALLALLLFNILLYSPAPRPPGAPAAVELHRRVFFNDFTSEEAFEGWWLREGHWGIEDGRAVQRDPAAYDARAQFEAPMSPMVLSARLRHTEGSGGGLMFDQTDGFAAHMVRYSDDGGGLIWGYFDESNAFVPQGYAGTSPPEDKWHILEIVRREETFDVWLDDERLITDAKRMVQGRGAALTASASVTEFDWVAVESLVIEPTPAGPP